METIIVTGGCGYIGSQTIIELLKTTPYHIHSIDNLSNASIEVLERIEKITGKKIQNSAIDLCNLSLLKEELKTLDKVIGIIHFAALKSVPDSVRNPHLYYQNNINSLLNVLEICDLYKIPNLIFSSSCSVYGNTTVLPVTESTPFAAPASPYAHTKVIGEQIIEQVVKKQNLSSVVLRYFNPAGADLSGLNGEDPRNGATSLVPVVTRTAAGIQDKMMVYGIDYPTRDGSCIRDFIHVVDLANAHILALKYLLTKNEPGRFECFNLGSGTGSSVLEVIDAFEKTTQVKVNYEIVGRREGDIVSIYSDCKKAEQVLGWKTNYTIMDIMNSSWKWQKTMSDNSGYKD